jgi:RimJ/RimL family protein N-acetyltransferase
MPALETARLFIRPFGADDLDPIHRILNEAFGETPHAERRHWLEWSTMNYTALARLYQPPYGDRAIVIKSSNTLIGSVGLVPCFGPFDTLPYFRERSSVPPGDLFTSEMGLFWALDAAYRGQGYATEAARALIDFAFADLALKRIVAMTDTQYRLAAVMQRLGDRPAQPEPHAALVSDRRHSGEPGHSIRRVGSRVTSLAQVQRHINDGAHLPVPAAAIQQRYLEHPRRLVVQQVLPPLRRNEFGQQDCGKLAVSAFPIRLLQIFQDRPNNRAVRRRDDHQCHALSPFRPPLAHMIAVAGVDLDIHCCHPVRNRARVAHRLDHTPVDARNRHHDARRRQRWCAAQ